MRARAILELERMLRTMMFAGIAGPSRKILLVSGYPNPGPEPFCAALCDAYQEGVLFGDGEVRSLNVGALCVAGEHFSDSSQIENALREFSWAGRLTVITPLLGDQLPVKLVTLFELASYRGLLPAPGGQVRTIITMDYPAFAHRALLQDDSGASSPYRFSLPGCRKPVFIGSIPSLSPDRRAAWLDSLRAWGVQDCEGRDERKPVAFNQGQYPVTIPGRGG